MAKGAGGLVLFTPELELELDFNKLSMENIPVELGADDSMMSRLEELRNWNGDSHAGGKGKIASEATPSLFPHWWRQESQRRSRITNWPKSAFHPFEALDTYKTVEKHHQK